MAKLLPRALERMGPKTYMTQAETRMDAWAKQFRKAEGRVRDARQATRTALNEMVDESASMQQHLDQLVGAAEGVWREVSQTVDDAFEVVRSRLSESPRNGNGRRET